MSAEGGGAGGAAERAEERDVLQEGGEFAGWWEQAQNEKGISNIPARAVAVAADAAA